MLCRFDEAFPQLHPENVFTQPQVHYLSFVLSEKGVTASTVKVNAVKQYPTPKCVKDIRAYLELAAFYRSLVPKFAVSVQPLTRLTRKDQNFSWVPLPQQVFDCMKEKLHIPRTSLCKF